MPDERDFAPLNEFERFVEARRLSANGLLWQVPGLSLTAQAFLVGSALNATQESVRIAVMAVAFVIAAATIQLLMRHRYREMAFSQALDLSREQRGVAPLDYPDDLLEQLAARRGGRAGAVYRKWNTRPLLRLGHWPAWKTWTLLFICFMALDVFVMFTA